MVGGFPRVLRLPPPLKQFTYLLTYLLALEKTQNTKQFASVFSNEFKNAIVNF
jgi:hypothetical protein